VREEIAKIAGIAKKSKIEENSYLQKSSHWPLAIGFVF
jgi:hypothetical protein